MCILLSTTEHKEFPFILLSNRDEYFKRPTREATIRSINNKQILSPCDLAREEHGSWIGVDDSGRIAVLVNYREEGNLNLISEISRGILPLDYISSDVDDEEWFENLETSLASRIAHDPNEKVEKISLRRIGGFSLLYGKLSLNQHGKIGKLNIISNRGDKGTVFDFDNIVKDKLHMTQSTIGLSNSLFYEPWDKVTAGTELLHQLTNNCENLSQEELVEKLFEILSTDTFDRSLVNKSFMDQLLGLRSTIFVPPLDTGTDGNDSPTNGRYYGTRAQTIILLDKTGHLHYYERNLHDSDDLSQSPKDQYFSFKVLNQ